MMKFFDDAALMAVQFRHRHERLVRRLTHM
ncbi:hypothetical protein Tam10B_1536 [Bifidobacterium vansinderenii]|uniref:Uncharacterized protein n=1 Tax=Bifidobacterium vansinderenii TaxID=1984871 RepID=A0A229VX37_9BIFI|nr:hypothetical protein Tam10B_1536 [Bifidobacterium vansinderenii]